MFSKIRCPHCNKLLLEASGEVRKICPKCKTEVRVLVTSIGAFELKSQKVKDGEWKDVVIIDSSNGKPVGIVPVFKEKNYKQEAEC